MVDGSWLLPLLLDRVHLCLGVGTVSSLPKTWQEIAEDEAKLADDRMEEALQTAKNALHEYKANPTRMKRINYLAAKRRYRERKAQQEEWWS